MQDCKRIVIIYLSWIFKEDTFLRHLPKCQTMSQTQRKDKNNNKNNNN